MDNIWSSKLKTPWRAAHRHQISEIDCENADIPNICEEVRGRLAGGGRGAGGVLQLGLATELLHGAALLLLDKTERTLQDTFELSQKIMLKNHQNVLECWNSEDELETEESEAGDSEVESVSSTGKMFGDVTNDLEMSKSLRTNEVLETASGGGAATLASSDESGNVTENEGNGSQDSRSKEEDAIEVEERVVQENREGDGEGDREGDGQGRGQLGRGFDPRLRLGVMLIYEDCNQNVPNKIFISSINPRTKL